MDLQSAGQKAVMTVRESAASSVRSKDHEKVVRTAEPKENSRVERWVVLKVDKMVASMVLMMAVLKV